MSDKNPNSEEISRRSILRNTVGVGVGITSLPHTVAAWEPASRDEIARLKTLPEVQAMLAELGHPELPENGEIRSQHIEGHGEIKTIRVKFDYGSLRFGELGDSNNATFRFSDVNHPDVPSKYKDIPDETEPILIADEQDVTLNREATEREKEAALAAIPETPAQSSVYTESGLNGYYVDVLSDTTDPENFEITEYVVEFQSKEVYPALSGSRDRSRNRSRNQSKGRLDNGRDLTARVEVETQGVKSKLIKDYVSGVIASNLGDELHECGSSCVGCADWIISMALDCRLCGPVCTSASTGVGAVICGVCVYQFCNNVGGMIECADCIACAVEGNSSWSNPTTPDIPEDIPGL